MPPAPGQVHDEPIGAPDRELLRGLSGRRVPPTAASFSPRVCLTTELVFFSSSQDSHDLTAYTGDRNPSHRFKQFRSTPRWSDQESCSGSRPANFSTLQRFIGEEGDLLEPDATPRVLMRHPQAIRAGGPVHCASSCMTPTAAITTEPSAGNSTRRHDADRRVPVGAHRPERPRFRRRRYPWRFPARGARIVSTARTESSSLRQRPLSEGHFTTPPHRCPNCSVIRGSPSTNQSGSPTRDSHGTSRITTSLAFSIADRTPRRCGSPPRGRAGP